MPVQEALVNSKNKLTAPCGVSFDVPANPGSNKANLLASDRQSWQATIPEAQKWIDQGWVIMALIQTRRHREWNTQAHQYQFKPNEDLLISVYLIKKISNPVYDPGQVLEQWWRRADVRLHKKIKENAAILPLWFCDQGLSKLYSDGITTFIDNAISTGSGLFKERTALGSAVATFVDKMRYGWRGVDLGQNLN